MPLVLTLKFAVRNEITDPSCYLKFLAMENERLSFSLKFNRGRETHF